MWIILITILVFFLTIVLGHIFFSQRGKTNLLFWTRIGHVAVFLSFVSLLLASISYFSAQIKYEHLKAEIQAKAELEKALVFTRTLNELGKALRSKGWVIKLRKIWDDSQSLQAEYSCEDILKLTNLAEQYLLKREREDIYKGHAPDQSWKAEVPITLFDVRNNFYRDVSGIEGLTKLQKNVFITRMRVFTDPYFDILYKMENMEQAIEMYLKLDVISSFWCIFLAFGLGFNVLKAEAGLRSDMKDKEQVEALKNKIREVNTILTQMLENQQNVMSLRTSIEKLASETRDDIIELNNRLDELEKDF